MEVSSIKTRGVRSRNRSRSVAVSEAAVSPSQPQTHRNTRLLSPTPNHSEKPDGEASLSTRNQTPASASNGPDGNVSQNEQPERWYDVCWTIIVWGLIASGTQVGLLIERGQRNTPPVSHRNRNMARVLVIAFSIVMWWVGPYVYAAVSNALWYRVKSVLDIDRTPMMSVPSYTNYMSVVCAWDVREKCLHSSQTIDLDWIRASELNVLTSRVRMAHEIEAWLASGPDTANHLIISGNPSSLVMPLVFHAVDHLKQVRDVYKEVFMWHNSAVELPPADLDHIMESECARVPGTKRCLFVIPNAASLKLEHFCRKTYSVVAVNEGIDGVPMMPPTGCNDRIRHLRVQPLSENEGAHFLKGMLSRSTSLMLSVPQTSSLLSLCGHFPRCLMKLVQYLGKNPQNLTALCTLGTRNTVTDEYFDEDAWRSAEGDRNLLSMLRGCPASEGNPQLIAYLNNEPQPIALIQHLLDGNTTESTVQRLRRLQGLVALTACDAGQSSTSCVVIGESSVSRATCNDEFAWQRVARAVLSDEGLSWLSNVRNRRLLSYRLQQSLPYIMQQDDAHALTQSGTENVSTFSLQQMNVLAVVKHANYLATSLWLAGFDVACCDVAKDCNKPSDAVCSYFQGAKQMLEQADEQSLSHDTRVRLYKSGGTLLLTMGYPSEAAKLYSTYSAHMGAVLPLHAVRMWASALFLSGQKKAAIAKLHEAADSASALGVECIFQTPEDCSARLQHLRITNYEVQSVRADAARYTVAFHGSDLAMVQQAASTLSTFLFEATSALSKEHLRADILSVVAKHLEHVVAYSAAMMALNKPLSAVSLVFPFYSALLQHNNYNHQTAPTGWVHSTLACTLIQLLHRASSASQHPIRYAYLQSCSEGKVLSDPVANLLQEWMRDIHGAAIADGHGARVDSTLTG